MNSDKQNVRLSVYDKVQMQVTKTVRNVPFLTHSVDIVYRYSIRTWSTRL